MCIRDRCKCIDRIKLSGVVKADHIIIETDDFVTYKEDLLTMDEFEVALGRTKTLKATGQYGFNGELFKYRGVSCLSLDYSILI